MSALSDAFCLTPLKGCSAANWVPSRRWPLPPPCPFLTTHSRGVEYESELVQDANLWDVASAPTIVMTQRGARQAFQDVLRDRGVEVVQFDFLTPDAVASYCFDRGFLQCLWECGGTLAAPAISARVIHKAMAFVAPKLVSLSMGKCMAGILC